MSIFTRLNLIIALALFSLIVFIVIVDQNLRTQDKLTIEYRQVARQENTLNRLQANVLERCVAALGYRMSGNVATLEQVNLREKIIREQLTQARGLNAAPTATLDKLEALERQYDKARKGYVDAINHIQVAAKEAISLEVSHEHTSMQEMLLDDLTDSLAVLVRFPTYNSPVKALDEELERLLAFPEHSNVEHFEQLAAFITRIQEQYVVSQQHITTMDSIGPELSRLVENAKLELIDKQNTLGPQLSAKIEQVNQTQLIGSAMVVIILLSLIWWSRRAIFNPLGNSLEHLRQNQQRLDSANASLRDDLHLDAAAAAQEPVHKTNEIQQFNQIAQSMEAALSLSENLSTTLKQQEAQIAELQKREAVDNLVAGMSHNLNNYLQPILLLSQHMNKPDKDAETQQMLSVITESAMNARNVLDKVLAYSRADAREQPASTDSLQAAINLVTTSVMASEIIEVNIQAHPQPFALAASDLNTVVLNLVNNSLDARDATTPITLWITGKVFEDSYNITLRDNGSGMDESTLGKAMNKFFTTKPVGKGTGLGLSEARELMEAAGGQLEITSTLGEGTTVSLSIPFGQHAEPTDG